MNSFVNKTKTQNKSVRFLSMLSINNGFNPIYAMLNICILSIAVKTDFNYDMDSGRCFGLVEMIHKKFLNVDISPLKNNTLTKPVIFD